MAGEFQSSVYGEFAADYRGSRLSALCGPNGGVQTGPFGSQLHQEDYVQVGTPIITVEHLGENRIVHVDIPCVSEADRERLSRYALRKGDIAFSRVGSVDRRSLVRDEEDGWLFSGRCLRVRSDPARIDARYLSYFFGLPAFKEHIKAIAVGATMPSLNTQLLSDVMIYYPGMGEQHAIAHILGTLDDKMELNRRMNETLEAMARAIFKSWFVDFDPVRAKHALSKVEGAEGRPSRTSGQTFSGLPKHLADLFPDSFEGSDLGEIPKGWAVKTIEAIATRVGMGPFGSSIKVETFVPAGVPVISGQHLHGFMVEDNTFNFVAPEHAERLKNAIVQRGDVVFTHAGNIGQAAYIPENSRYDRYVISQRQFFMRCDPAQVTPSFVAFYFRSPEGQHRLLANASSSGVPSIARPVTYLRSIQLSIPPNPIMDAFEKLVQPLLLQFRRNLNEVSTLATLRDTLLPKLISGELRVTGLEQAIPGDGHREVERDSRKQP